MRFAFASFRYFPFGGLEKDMLRMAECAAARGHEAVILTGAWEDDKLPDTPGITVEIVPTRGKSNHARAASFCRNIKEVIAQGNFDCVLGLNRIPGCDFYFAADNCYAVEMPKKHAKWVLKTLPRYRTYLALEEAVAGKDSKTVILYIADHQKRDYQSCYATPDERLVLLPPGMNPACRRNANALETRAAKRRELQISDDQFMLLLVGSNFRQKGGDRAIRALAALPENIRSNCRLIFAGADKPDFCLKLARELDVVENIRFIGPRKDVPELLVSCDVLLLPARNEATGTVIVEAVSSGAPVIASGECGYAKYAALAGSTVLPEPWQDSAFPRAIEELYLDRERALRHAVEYSSTVNYTQRADRTIDLMEDFAK